LLRLLLPVLIDSKNPKLRRCRARTGTSPKRNAGRRKGSEDHEKKAGRRSQKRKWAKGGLKPNVKGQPYPEVFGRQPVKATASFGSRRTNMISGSSPYNALHNRQLEVGRSEYTEIGTSEAP